MPSSNTKTVRIEWGDCDPAGIIFYPRYFGIFDSSTTALFEAALGMTKIKFIEAYDFLGYPLVDTRARFLRPVRFGDDVVVTSSVDFGTSSF
ncbi:MAG: acyl-CoA thioesterase, partial [Pseudolabrys sp.]|nr:acyl-CoA thioesterase [Pseudolabrys sp.]